MKVVETQSVQRCKLCSHESRTEIDQILLKRSLGEADDEGRWNIERVLKALGELGVTNPTKENVTIHWRKHCEAVSEEVVQEREEAKEAVAARSMAMADEALGVGWRERVLSPDEYLILVRIAAQHDLALRMASGERTGATIDHGLKSVGEVTKRKSSEALDDVRKGIGAAVEQYVRAQTPLALPIGGSAEGGVVVPETVEVEVLAEEEA